MAERGGKRDGAGRPKGSVTRLRVHDFMTEKDVKKLFKKAMELVDGVKVQKYDKKGVPTIYDVPPNGPVIIDLIKQICGTAPPALKINDEPEKPKEEFKFIVEDFTDE